MKEIYQSTLFDKRILVAERDAEPEQDAFAVVYALAELFSIRIVSGEELAQRRMLRFAAEQLGKEVPEPFYRGFPESVKSLTADQRLLDQIVHYTVTYGFGLFGRAGHSLLENVLERKAFQEKTEPQDFTIVSEDEAEALLRRSAEDLLQSSRPLNERQYQLLRAVLEDYPFEIKRCASKNTAVRLLADTRDLELVRFLRLSDVIKLVDEINFRVYENKDLRKLNLRNQDRKFLSAVMDRLFELGRCDLETCYEKKAIWCGLLHQLHYRPKCEEAGTFADSMRGRENRSVYSAFEKALAAGDTLTAARVLKEGKGSGALLRSLNHILSRCGSPEERDAILRGIETDNVVLLIQLLLRYADGFNADDAGLGRDFCFTKYNMLKLHSETEEEIRRRRSRLSPEERKQLFDFFSAMLRERLRGRLGKVYVDPEMRRIALPVQETTAQGGLGVLARGSRIPIGEGRKLRAFTYWEQVDDIDLSAIGLDGEGNQTEFSWRTMSERSGDAIVYSGDETSGFFGGSEYFDIDLEELRKQYPALKYLVLCDNVYSNLSFDKLVCRAGYMLRDNEDSGAIFEPKTVRSAFRINCSSRFAYLFGIDLERREMVWLNAGRSSGQNIAGESSLAFLIPSFHVTEVINLYSFFELMAAELVEDPREAEWIVSDRLDALDADAERIHSYDFDRILALMNR